MVIATMVLKAVSLFVAELLSSITDWFQTKPAWANLEVLENTELKSTGDGEQKKQEQKQRLNVLYDNRLIIIYGLCWTLQNI